MSHTPGPWQWYWRVDDDLKADCGVFSERLRGQAYSVARCPQFQGQTQWEADASLIAAAPDLLEFAEQVDRLLSSAKELGLHLDIDKQHIHAQALAVIKKARGQ